MKKRTASANPQAQKRRDLARELIPQDARRAYLHPGKRGLPGTLLGMYRPLLKNPRIILSTLLYALSAGLLPLLGVLVVQHLAGLLASPGATAGSMFTAAGLYAAAFFLLWLNRRERYVAYAAAARFTTYLGQLLADLRRAML